MSQPNITGLDPTALAASIQAHKKVQGDITGYISQAKGGIDNLTATSSGTMVSSVESVFEEWQGQMNRVQDDLGSMINQLQSTLNYLQSQDQSNKVG